jgi:hypothetical protein
MQPISYVRRGGRGRCGLRALRHVSLVAGILIPLMLAGPARAQPQPPAVASSGAVPDRKSPATALQLSLLGTGAGFGMMVAGARWELSGLSLAGFAATLIGPSAGHFYAGEAGRGLVHTGLRAGAVATVVAGATWGFFDCLDLYGEDTCEFSPGATALIIGGVVLGAGSTIYSLYDAPRAARRHNARARRLMLVPAPMTVQSSGAGSAGFGLHLGGSF